jgi:uncharacterized protein YqgC (DUF456 family)
MSGAPLLLNRKNDLQTLFWLLGMAITLPMALLSGPLAGYFLSQWLIQRWHFNSKSTIILVLLGLLGSLVQTVRIVKRMYKGSDLS